MIETAKKIGGAVVTLFLLFVFAGPIQTQIHNIREQQYVDTFNNVTTAAEVTTANVTLSQSLLRGRDGLPNEIISLYSTDNTDVPHAQYYDGLGSKSLLITGLTAGATRTLTLTYNGQRGGDADNYMAAVGPFLTFLVFGGIIVFLVIKFRSKKGG